MRSTNIRLTILIGALVAVTAVGGFAQGTGTMARPVPPSNTRDSSGNLKTDNGSSSSESAVRGQVTLADGSIPERLVAIYSVCGGAEKFISVADAKGRFNFNPGVLSENPDPKSCVLRASLEGYRSETKPLSDIKPDGITKLGKITLQPLSTDATGLNSATSAQANKAAKKAYEKGLEEAAKQAWADAKTSFLKATSAYNDYAAAWLALGVLQQSEGDRDSALKSFGESARADPKFAVPLIAMAALDSLRGDWAATVEHSQKAIDLNPTAFPHAYELNALGNLNQKNIEAVQKTATEGLKIDTEHHYPELEYLLGVVLLAQRDNEGASKHLQAYIEESPNGPNVARAKSSLETLRASH